MFNFYRKTADILVLQETHTTVNSEREWQLDWGGKILFSHGSESARGVCILIKPKFYCNTTNLRIDAQGRFIACDLETMNNFKFALCCIYAPNDDNPAFFDNIDQNMAQLHWNKLIIGDFNLVLDTQKDRYNSCYNNSAASQKLLEIMNEHDLSDTWRVRNPCEIAYSWRNSAQTSASRIDFFIISKAIEPMCEHCQYIYGVMSDHSAVFLSLKDFVHERGPGYWKANASLLENISFATKFKNAIKQDVLAIECESSIERWKRIKSRIIKTMKRMSRDAADERNLLIAQLAEKVSEYQETFPLNQYDYHLYLQSVADLHELLNKKAESLIFRSRAKWHEAGEKTTKYFFQFGKRQE